MTTDAEYPSHPHFINHRGISLDFTAIAIANGIRQKEWDPKSVITLSFRGNELAGEVGEACNLIKKLERIRLNIKQAMRFGEVSDLTDALAKELADVVICVDLIAADLGIDLGLSITDKFNETSRKHGLSTRL